MAYINYYKLTLNDYNSLFNSMYKPLCLFANKYLESLDDSKDIVQDVFVKIWENKIVFKDEHATKSYLYTSIKNKCLDKLKSKSYKSTDFLATINLEKIESEHLFLSEIVITETSIIIENAISTLPNKCAKIIRMSLKGLANFEIADELDISINTVKAQKKIAYKRLKPLLEEYFIFIAIIFKDVNY